MVEPTNSPTRTTNGIVGNIFPTARKKRVLLVLKALLSIGIIVFLASKIDISAMARRLAQQDAGMFVLALGILTGQMLIHAVRWHTILNIVGASLPFIQTLKILTIALFFNQVLPTGIGGDVVRIWKTYNAGVGTSPTVNSVILERICHLVGLLVLLMITQPLLDGRLPFDVMRWTLPLTVLCVVGAIGVLMTLGMLPKSWRYLRAVRAVGYLSEDMRRIFLKPVTLSLQISISVFGHCTMILAIYVLAIGLSVDVTAMDALALIPPVLIVSALPISINSWGVREAAMIGMLGLIGVPSEAALSLSIVFGFSVLLTRLPGGVVWMAQRSPA